LRQPRVQADLKKLSSLGADRERVLALLASIAFNRKRLRIYEVLRERERALRDFSDQLYPLVLRANDLLSDHENSIDYWVRALSLQDEVTFVTPRLTVAAVEDIEKCEAWSRANAKAFRHLRVAFRKTERTKGIIALMKHILQTTKKNRDTILARLLNGAHDALSLEKTFTDAMLKKMRQRYPRGKLMASREMAEISKINWYM